MAYWGLMGFFTLGYLFFYSVRYLWDPSFNQVDDVAVLANNIEQELMYPDDPNQQTATFFKFRLGLAVRSRLLTRDGSAFEAVGRRVGICFGCKVVVRSFLFDVSIGKTADAIGRRIIRLCTTLRMAQEAVCSGLFNALKDSLYYLAQNRNQLASPEEICSAIAGKQCTIGRQLGQRWQIHIPQILQLAQRSGGLTSSTNKTISVADNTTIVNDTLPKAVAVSSEVISTVVSNLTRQARTGTFQVVHISDTHYDPLYQEGSNAVCGRPLCCRSTDGSPQRVSEGAGKWGDYRDCDTPKILLENLLTHIAVAHKDASFVIWTGDIPPHNVWSVTKEEALENLDVTVSMFKQHLSNFEVYPALGNHEAEPVNMFPSPETAAERPDFSKDWFYNALAKEWPHLFHVGEEQLPTIKKAGFYSVKPVPGLRLIAMNTNYCYYLNWFNYLNIPDPAGELDWLSKQLVEAEKLGEKVHIIGHVPTGYSDCIPTWSKNYRRLVERFRSTITGQFFGHTHYDDVQIFYDSNGKPFNVAYIGPSVTPFVGINPAYRVYTIDSTTMEMVDYTTYYMDLLSTNAFDQPRWLELYSAKSAYNLADLSPNTWHNWVNRLVWNNDAFQTHYRHTHRASQFFRQCTDRECKRERLCTIVTADTSDPWPCLRLMAELERYYFSPSNYRPPTGLITNQS